MIDIFRRIAWLSALVAAAPVLAGHVSSKDYDIVTLAEGVHGFVWRDPSAQPVEGNALFIVNDRDVVVVDTGLLPETTRTMADELRKLTDKPVRYVVNTHWHDDHTNGNGIYRELFPGVQIVAQANTRKDHVEQTIEARPKNMKAFEDQSAKYARWAETGKDDDGKEIVEVRRQRMREFAQMVRDNAAALRTVKDSPPDVTFEKALVLYRGARTIEIRYLGRGNTRGDAVVFLPKERIVVTGDLLVYPIPYMFGSFYSDWPETLAKLDALPADTLFLMHGAPQKNRDYLHQVQGLLRAMVEQASIAAATGLPADEAAKKVDLKTWATRFAGEDAMRLREFEVFVIQPAMERAIRQIRKEPGAFEENVNG